MRLDNKDKFVYGNTKDFSQTKGYFIGRFMGEKGRPDLETDEVEVAWKVFPIASGEETLHYHKEGIEINIVVSGGYKVLVGGVEKEIKKGDFLVVYPETKLKTLSIEGGSEIIVVKAPSVPGDKFEWKE